MKKHDENCSESGFQKLNPFKNYSGDYADMILGNKSIKKEYKSLIRESRPYCFFITLTFGRNVSSYKKCQFTDVLLHRYNQKLFSRNYKEKEIYLEGFAIFESHASSKLADRYHVHMLIRYNERYDKYDLNSHRDIFNNAAAKVLDGQNRRVFNDKCIDIREAGDDGRIDYCTKQISDLNVSQIKPIGKDGLSDYIL